MLELLKDLWAFMRENKKFWLAPIIVVMVLLGGLIILAQGSAVAPSFTRCSELSIYTRKSSYSRTETCHLEHDATAWQAGCRLGDREINASICTSSCRFRLLYV